MMTASNFSSFIVRHIGPDAQDQKEMLDFMGEGSLDAFIDQVVPQGVRSAEGLVLKGEGYDFGQGLTENEALRLLASIARKNEVYRNYIGAGYYGTITPPVIRRSVLENPGWYTQYTPYQPEISQGRLEALLNYQTMISELTGLPLANASLLDEATAVAEAVVMCRRDSVPDGGEEVLLHKDLHPQTLKVVVNRLEPLGITVKLVEGADFDVHSNTICVVLQLPGTLGNVTNLEKVIQNTKESGARLVVASDLLALCMMTPVEADIYVGTSQRFGVPMAGGGPHAAFIAVKDEFKRKIPGRLVGVSKDVHGKRALRLALQTREQHIRREKATSNICTAQVLLAVMAGMYGVYHGPQGLREIAERVHNFARRFAESIEQASKWVLPNVNLFDTVYFEGEARDIRALKERAQEKRINLRYVGKFGVAVAFDETVTESDFNDLCYVCDVKLVEEARDGRLGLPKGLRRQVNFMQQEVFRRYRSETELLRYIRRLENRDLSLCHSMIPLGSCTMKLNATSEMEPVSWPYFADMHPFAPYEQLSGTRTMVRQIESALCEITGMEAVSLQPNAGSQGEYAGLLAIKAYHNSRGDKARTVCLIPVSAHGTNPASAVMAGFRVVSVKCDANGDIDLKDLERLVEIHQAELGALMVTYPSTHGVFEDHIRQVAALVHRAGGQVYMDGANMNALVGLVKPGSLGVDVCHLNLHKTFCIPHGGGGPGVGPTAVKAHLVDFLPYDGNVLEDDDERYIVGPVSAAPWGSAGILPITWMYLRMMGASGLTQATKVAILSANYIMQRLKAHYKMLYASRQGYVAHECIVDLRPLKALAGVEVDDVAKRLIDYGFHAPTVSWPVAGTIMIEPTESESKRELDRFCDAMIAIKQEAEKIARGEFDRVDNPLKGAPHTLGTVTSDEWNRSYSRNVAAFPLALSVDHKFWPFVGRVDAVYGDRNLICACGGVEDYVTE
jgi:glycine dehydrogenase